MPKLLPTTLIATSLLLGLAQYPSNTWAGTCTQPNCPPRSLQFTPGQRVRLLVVNTTSSLVQLQKVYGTDPIPLRPGQELVLNQGDGTQPNISLIFWDATGLPLQTNLSKPDDTTLRIELRPGGRPPGDRSIYILNDGHIKVY
ncbi:MAG: hypothetical protein VKL59_08745 [Nostocaceae cyanobacterium]|nr:hypothetical protein [Nostocaceae cyanobacterium]